MISVTPTGHRPCLLLLHLSMGRGCCSSIRMLAHDSSNSTLVAGCSILVVGWVTRLLLSLSYKNGKCPFMGFVSKACC